MTLQIFPTQPGYVLTRDGTALFCRDWRPDGQAKSPTFVFLTGWALSSEMWAYQMLPLVRDGYRCVAYDRRGHGRSSDPGRGFDYDTLAGDLADVLATLDLDDVVLVAHSMAGGEAVRYLNRHGHKGIRGLVLIAPAGMPFLVQTPDNPDGIPVEALAAEHAAVIADFPGWCDSKADAYFVPGTARTAIDWTLRTMSETSFRAVADLNHAVLMTDFRSELPRLDLPVLILHGDRDESAPLELTGRRAAALIKGARLEVYQGAPHGLYFTHQERINSDLRQFADIVMEPA